LRINVATVLVEKAERNSSYSVLVIIAALNEEEGIGPTLAGADRSITNNSSISSTFEGVNFYTSIPIFY